MKVPPTASRRAYGLLPNEKQSPSNPPKNTANTQQQRPPITAKRRRPRPKGGNNIAFNNGCCN
ncbi:replication protein [Salmonella enterica subsp. enterica]|nr:replication protein [Salmonella enterica]EBZ0864416.1 replication protein [Salmonella enterica subsp. enterica serovar Ajiobo]ECF3350338.1 replication protein [Salmonella enterica subsp. enterica serovar Typhimurium]ECI5282572.1 replication protein [Salmonella enterica subsp. arizonae]ECJ4569494.1 replication protein [Salmonella enterica subsp. enterica serovar Javiana]EFB2710054.1 replication protein [Escherichia coli O157:H7]EFX2491443.1 replication protein [Shigella sonnei]